MSCPPEKNATEQPASDSSAKETTTPTATLWNSRNQQLWSMVMLVLCVMLAGGFVGIMRWRHGLVGDLDRMNSIEYQLRTRINTATEAELAVLPGVGPVLASAIVEYRRENFPIRNEEELAEVPGIGPVRIEQLRQYLDFMVDLPDSTQPKLPE